MGGFLWHVGLKLVLRMMVIGPVRRGLERVLVARDGEDEKQLHMSFLCTSGLANVF